MRTSSPNSICSHRAGSARNALSLWLSLVFPLVKFFGFDWCCWSALHVPFGLGHCLGRSLSVWEGYIHWLVPAGAAPLVTWSGALTRRCPAGASVPAVWPAEWSPGSSSVQSVWGTSHAGWRVNLCIEICPCCWMVITTFGLFQLLPE